MRRMKVAATAALLASLGVIAGAQQFRTGVDLVSFVVVASDKKGLVHGLTKDDFVLLEDGKPQTIQFFKQGDASERLNSVVSVGESSSPRSRSVTSGKAEQTSSPAFRRFAPPMRRM